MAMLMNAIQHFIHCDVVLVYSGVLDFICNYFGGRAWTDATKWSGQVYCL